MSMNKQHTVKRLMCRLARLSRARITARQISDMTATFLSWPRAKREAWILARYEDLTRYVGFEEEELAAVIV